MTVKSGQHGVKCVHCGSTRLRKDGTGTASNEGKQRYQCTKCRKRTTLVAHEEARGISKGRVAALHHTVRQSRRFVVTAAQNATPVNKAFLAALQAYCKHTGAQLLVIPYRYKNPTSHWGKNAENDDWWAPELTPYLYDRRVKLNKHLMLLGDIKTQPTANSPLQGFESITGQLSAIIGHPKLELTTIPTPQQRMPKLLTTTGAVTLKNYLPSKAGKKGEFHHTYGACVVEIEGKKFHLRQLNAVKDGSFMDLRHHYAAGKVTEMDAVSALILGDTHVEFMDPQVDRATFGKGGLVDTLLPSAIVWHDVHDFYARTHHHQHDAFIEYVKHTTGTDNVEKALDQTFAFVDERTRHFAKNVFVYSNHPDMLARWVKRADWRTDPRNAKFLLKTALVMLEGARMEDSGAQTIDPFRHWAKEKLQCFHKSVFLDLDESYQIEGIEVGYHGHYGLNGARGTRSSFARIGTKVVIGHGHSPGIREGAYQVGTNSRLKLEYVKGPSSWLHTDCVIYRNGKRSLINIIDGKWRA